MASDMDPKWLRDIRQLLSIRSHFVVSGNIRDQVLKQQRLLSLESAIWEVLQPLGYTGILIWDMTDGLHAFPKEPERIKSLSDFSGVNLSKPQAMKMQALTTLMRKLSNPPKSTAGEGVALIIDYASRIQNEGQMDAKTHEFFIAAEKFSLSARPVVRDPSTELKPMFNAVFWLLNRANDLPWWMTVDNERMHAVPIPLPDADTRKSVAELLWGVLPVESQDANAEQFGEDLSSLSHNFTLNALNDITTLAAQQLIPASDINDAVQSYRIGDTNMSSPWQGEQLRESIIAAETGEHAISNRVKGQSRAVARVLDILKRTSIGLTGAHTNANASRPRGVLFFVGPTGVGKTEMAKTIAQVVFGDESAYLRFDMSEFSAEHSGDRLIGAPPGYVGFDQGGELTNAMREQPFRVLLFDEIEKAAPRILDKFLQILEDGRLTDGRGETVYFSESLIIFTSNTGISRRNPDGSTEILVTSEDDKNEPQSFEDKIHDGVRNYFQEELRRPELLNRIGENVVVFHYIQPTVAVEIMDAMITNVRQRLDDEHGVSLELSDEAHQALRKHCVDGGLSNGGRGIGSKLEEALVNPLARLLFNKPQDEGSTLLIKNILQDADRGWEIIA